MLRHHLSHGRAITTEELSQKGVKIKRAPDISEEFNEALDDLQLVYHQYFAFFGALKVNLKTQKRPEVKDQGNTFTVLPCTSPTCQLLFRYSVTIRT